MALTPEEIKKIRESSGLAPLPETAQDTGTSLADRFSAKTASMKPKATIADNIKSDLATRKQNISKELGDTTQNPIVSGFKAVEEVAKGAGDVIANVAKPAISAAAKNTDMLFSGNPIYDTGKAAINMGIDNAKKIADKTANSKTVENIGTRLNELATKYPEAENLVNDTLEILSAGGTIANTILGVEAAATSVPKIARATTTGIEDAVTAIRPSGPAVPTVKPITDATPRYSKKLISDPQIQYADGTVKPRVEGAGSKFKTDVVNPTPAEIAANTELEALKGYPRDAKSLDKANFVQNDINTKAKALESSLKDEKVLRPPKEVAKIIRDAVNSASDNSLLLQKTDPIVSNYLRVTERAIAQSEGTLAGELQVRKALDKAYEAAGGKYAGNKGLDQIHRAARDAVNADLEAKAVNVGVKASLKQQSNLYRALDVLQENAMIEGGSDFIRFVKKHPVLSKLAEKTADLTGLGTVVDILK